MLWFGLQLYAFANSEFGWIGEPGANLSCAVEQGGAWLQERERAQDACCPVTTLHKYWQRKGLCAPPLPEVSSPPPHDDIPKQSNAINSTTKQVAKHRIGHQSILTVVVVVWMLESLSTLNPLSPPRTRFKYDG